MIRRPRIREMDATNERKCFRMALLLILLPMVVAIDESVAQPGSIIQMAESGETEESKQRFIITARALEGQQELEEDVEDVGNTLEPEEFVEEESTSIDYEAQVTDETEAPMSTSIDTTELPTTTISPPANTTVNGLFTSTTVPAYTTERVPTTSKLENELVNDDLSPSSSNLDTHQIRRTDSMEEAASDHPVLYARIKHPLPPNVPIQEDVSIGSLFGRPYNGRPFVPRLTTERGGTPIQLPNPDGLSEALGEVAGWNLKSPSRWEKEKAENQRINMTRVRSVDAECQNDFMKVRIRFNGSFSGIIYSSGFAYDPLCVYVNGTGRDYYEFFIQLNRCGTLGGNTHNLDSRKQPTKNFMWNTLSIQYSALIEEEWDEHYKMTCEYGYDYWKTVTFPFLDVEVATGNPLTFTLTPPECHMEIRAGYGTNGNRVTGPVRVGDPLTLVVYMRSQFDGFDVIVSDCYAHNGANKKIQLIDNNGCPLNEKLISRFRGSWTDAGLYETQVFAYMKAFRFTGSPALYIECDVRMCHGHCPTQPCYWRNSRETVSNVSKRDVSGLKNNPATLPSVNNSSVSTLSENLSLFQALQVIADDEATLGDYGLAQSGLINNTETIHLDHVCLKPVTIGAVLGLGGLITLILGIVSCFLMIRLRRRSQSESALYSHHPYSTPSFAMENNHYAKHRNFQ